MADRTDRGSLPFIDLDVRRDGEQGTVDPVNARVALLFQVHEWRRLGVLAFGWSDDALNVATGWPPHPDVQERLARLNIPVQMFVADDGALKRAFDRVYGPENDRGEPRFGEVALRLGKLDEAALEEALAYQRHHGGRLGQILTGLRHLTFWDVAEIVAAQRRLPLVNLLTEMGPIGGVPWHLMPREFWFRHHIVPLEDDGQVLRVAVEDPDTPGLHALTGLGRIVMPVVTGRRDIVGILGARYAHDDLAHSREALAASTPHYSAQRLLTPCQTAVLVALAAAVGAGLWRNSSLTLIVLSSLRLLTYAVMVTYRFWFVQKATGQAREATVSQEELQELNDWTLPTYTVLIPIRDEVAVLPTLARAVEALDYPKDRLDVKLLVEQDDYRTIQAALRGDLASYIEIVPVPPDEPRTKPKACNYGLQRALGEFVTIFDAEDIPDPDQLKKAVALFRRADRRIACIQAKLSYFNRDQNLLTRWFTAEYAVWFDLYLPALQASGHPIPLGGSSNHFRTEVLREVGGWDPFNVTEDADLGIRLHRAGYRTEVMDSTTYEEANSEFVNWVRQRSRWVKGYLQTWIVHMRHPVSLYRQLGFRGFWSFQMSLLGTPLMFLLNPVYWLLTSLWFATQWAFIGHLFPVGIYYIGMLNLLAGNFVFAYLSAVACARRGDWELVKYAILSPLYWSMMSLGAWKAFIQLVLRPSHWEKTAHGLMRGQAVDMMGGRAG